MFQTALILSLVILFIHASTWEGMIFNKVNEAFYHAPVWLKKPLYDCPACMCPWWGFGIYTLAGIYDALPYYNPLQLALILLTAGGINIIAGSLIDFLHYGGGSSD